LIWGSGKQKYFCKRGWTGKPPPPALICPSGKSRLHLWSCEGRVLIDFARYESPLCDCRQQRTFANSRLLIIERKKEKPPRGRLRNPIRCFGQAASAAAFRFLRPAEQRVRRTKKCCPWPVRKIPLRLLNSVSCIFILVPLQGAIMSTRNLFLACFLAMFVFASVALAISGVATAGGKSNPSTPPVTTTRPPAKANTTFLRYELKSVTISSPSIGDTKPPPPPPPK
jgi:hypothetical protein